MQPLFALRDRAIARWNAAVMRERILFLVGVATVLTLAFLAYARASRVEMAVLFSGLAERDAAGIVARLRETHVPYELGADGTILVPEQSVAETRLSLAGEGALEGDGYNLFDTQRFGESEFVEQVQYLRALEGELGRTISHLGGVASARVHLVLPQRSLLDREDAHASAAVTLHMEPGHRASAEQVRGIVALAASSVRGLVAENVTVVDGEGRRLSGGADEDESESARDAETLRERIEDSRERDVQEFLDRTFGVGATAVRLAADVSFAHQERLEERYDPNGSAIVSRATTIDGADADATPGSASGIAGAVSALPGGPSAESEARTVAPGGHREDTINLHNSSTTTRTVEPLGRVTRLSLAVLVDGRWEGEGDARHFVARTDEELASIRAAARTAAGLDESRGDSLTVECVPFVVPAADPETIAAATPGVLGLATWQLASVAAVALAALVVAIVVIVRRRRRSTTLAVSAEPALPSPLASPTTPAAHALSLDVAPVPDAELDQDAIRVRVIDLARRDPELAARIVRGWLSEGDGAVEAPAPATT